LIKYFIVPTYEIFAGVQLVDVWQTHL